MELCFFLRVEVGTVELVTTDIRSQNIFVVPLSGTPNILSLYLMDAMRSTVILMATNLDPNVDYYICSGFPRGCGAYRL